MKIFTIGFAKKSAETFFARLMHAGVKRLVDVRLNNVSQLAASRRRRICGISQRLSATSITSTFPNLRQLLKSLTRTRTRKMAIGNCTRINFLDLIRARHIESTVAREVLDGGCLLCSEAKPHHCHRRLVAEYLKEHWQDVEIEHIP
jgi:uncharacterized protein (DUF488 family)